MFLSHQVFIKEILPLTVAVVFSFIVQLLNGISLITS